MFFDNIKTEHKTTFESDSPLWVNLQRNGLPNIDPRKMIIHKFFFETLAADFLKSET